ncbi:phytoene/squalene synthase family protein, partial [Candidatus Bipolaricaulota bacterium]|nr:phytoene/squalene synthase family protein [Candidatus Bipolaricaulota bacterium]
LADTIERYGVSPDDLADVLAGVEMDLTRTRYATFDDLREYCYHVASAVGLATLPILNDGIPPTDAMREHAIDLGLGMQLVNILRDVAEDLARDRVYLPQEELHRFGVNQSALARGVMTEPLRLLLAFQAARGVEYLERGSQLLTHVPRSGRPCLWLLAEIYGRLLRRIIAADYAVFAGRVSLPKWEKLGLLAIARWRV